MSNYKVIDSDNYRASGIETFFFPGGEPHVKLPEELPEKLLVVLKLRTWNDVGVAACLLDALKRRPALGYEDYKVFIPYFPGARQDRTNGKSPVTVEVAAKLLAFLKWPCVFDLHSRVSGALPARYVRNWMPSELRPALPLYSGVIAPDKGAAARAFDMAQYLGDLLVLTAEKVREFETGNIVKYDLRMLYEPGERYLVVDDICDGGATFNILADSVPKDVKLDLWVSHGIFSKGVSAISERYERIFTTDSWYQRGWHPGKDIYDDGSRVTVFPLEPLYDKIMES